MKMVVVRGSGHMYAFSKELAARGDVDVVEVEVELDKSGKPIVGTDGHYVVKSQKPASKDEAPAEDKNVQVEIEE